jgi:hypothetical protein
VRYGATPSGEPIRGVRDAHLSGIGLSGLWTG